MQLNPFNGITLRPNNSDYNNQKKYLAGANPVKEKD